MGTKQLQQRQEKASRKQDKVFKTIPDDLSNKVPVKINDKTTIYIAKGRNPDQAKERFIKKHFPNQI